MLPRGYADKDRSASVPPFLIPAGGLPETQDYTVWRLDKAFTVDPAEFLSMGKAQPFTGMELYGRCVLTVHDGREVWKSI